MKEMKKIPAFALLIPALAIGAVGGWMASAAESDIRRDAIVEAVEQVMPSVVNIATETVVAVQDPFEAMFRRFYGQQSSDTFTSLGSGVVIDETGYLLTNDHVVRRADKIAVKFNTGTNVYEASVVASDPKRDVALLKIKSTRGEKFRAIRLAREDDLLLGETVLAMGNPFGLGGTVTRGILSSKSRVTPEEGSALQIPNWLQTDAPINPGNSGGPLVNLKGELIGINVAVFNRTQEGEPVQGIGFAIPIRLVEEALGDILPTEYVKAYWFGARVKVGSYPLVITSVQADSPADRAGLKIGDTVLEVHGKVPKNFIDFGDLLASKPAGEIPMTIRRGGDTTYSKLSLVPISSVFNANMVQRTLGLKLEPLRRPNLTGFVITEVEKDSPAGLAGLQSGMVIAAIDGQVLQDITDVAKLVHEKKKGEAVQLNVVLIQRTAAGNYVRRGSVELTPR
jgi:serine protease Do